MNEFQTSNIKPPNGEQLADQKGKTQKDKVYDLRERLLRFSKTIIRRCGELPLSPEAQVIRRQLARSGTAIGANFEEADGALTRKDFINKLAVSRKEAKETKYWLRIVAEHYIKGSKEEIEREINENEEIIRILSAILKKVGYQFRV